MCEIKFSKFAIKTERPAFVMGIVNATPDSFFDKSRGGQERAFKLIEEGADIIDVGGESTRPGYTAVDEDEEIKRVLPVIKAIRKQYDSSKVRISVDTCKASVFKAAYEEGADILNDVTALSYDSKMLSLCKELNVPVILMHQGSGLAADIAAFFKKRVDEVLTEGIEKQNIILDPGIGFGKTNEECIEIIKNTQVLTACDYPLLMALSRKRCIGQMTGRETAERLYGTLAADMISVQKGAKLIRVHDVSAAIDTLNVMKYLQ